MEEQLYILEYEKLQDFMLGGKADFVIVNKNNEHRINYIIKKFPYNDNKFKVSYKSHIKIDIGYIVLESQNIISFQSIDFKHLAILSKERAETFKGLFNFVFVRNMIPNNVSVCYTGRCSICGRKLTDPEYIRIGIGKKCLEEM